MYLFCAESGTKQNKETRHIITWTPFSQNHLQILKRTLIQQISSKPCNCLLILPMLPYKVLQLSKTISTSGKDTVPLQMSKNDKHVKEMCELPQYAHGVGAVMKKVTQVSSSDAVELGPEKKLFTEEGKWRWRKESLRPSVVMSSTHCCILALDIALLPSATWRGILFKDTQDHWVEESTDYLQLRPQNSKQMKTHRRAHYTPRHSAPLAWCTWPFLLLQGHVVSCHCLSNDAQMQDFYHCLLL